MIDPMPVPRTPSKMFETRSQAWREVGLLRQISPRVVKRARLEALVLVPLFVAFVVLYDHRAALFGREVHTYRDSHGVLHPAHKYLEPALETPITVVTVIALVILGWAIARDIGRSLGPPLFRRLDPATAGTAGFLIRLLTIILALLVAFRVAGIQARTLALGGAFTAVIFGLAAQQTLGNVIAGTVLLSARPFRVGDRVRLQGGPLAGQLEGTVSSLGLLYTTFAKGEDSIMVPNSVVLNSAVIPLREPEAVNLRARLRAGMTPADLQELLEASLRTPLRDPPRITLEELDGEEVVVRIAATPRIAAEGRQLASELLGIVSRETRAGAETRPDRAPGERESTAGSGPDRQDGEDGEDGAGNGHAPSPSRPAAPPPGDGSGSQR
ncbi:MAG TPA: mechanosensitive ion channel family protein [Solirubrobacteraceae bacterium]|jgi:small-conductance mechanosensitive channel